MTDKLEAPWQRMMVDLGAQEEQMRVEGWRAAMPRVPGDVPDVLFKLLEGMARLRRAKVNGSEAEREVATGDATSSQGGGITTLESF